MLDVHVAVSAGTRPDWVRQCLDSVDVAAARAGYPVAVHIVDGVPGHIGKARTAGFSAGSAPWVTYVDDDDYVLPDAFSVLADAMAHNPAAIFTGEVVEQNGQQRPSPGRHHLSVYRRDVIAGIDLSPWFVCADWRMRKVVEAHPDGVIDVPECVYVHRVYFDSRARVMRRTRKTELREVVAAHG